MNNFEESIWNWLKKCPHFQDLFFMVANLEATADNETVISPEISGSQPEFIMQFIDGSGVKQYICNIAQYINMVTSVNSTENISSWESIKKLQEWIIKQVKKNKWPEWDYPIEDIVVTGMMQAGSYDGNVKGQFQIIINYLEGV